MTADRLDGQAGAFRTAHQAAQSRASKAALGSGSAATALPGMLAAWEADSARFDRQLLEHARRHREAADSYERTDAGGADAIDDAGPAQ
ncbi:ESX-1 secretion-associated protein [Mycobacterium sp. IDR2000157661]|nr:ESX-1 secretion-associated protein [Mycobacterium sp. IDR2000157661]